MDRDKTPAIPKRLNVSAYPSLLLLGPKEENIHRFQSFQLPEPFLAQLAEGQRRWKLFREGGDWGALPVRPAWTVEGGRLDSLKAPSDAVPGGLVLCGEDLLCSQQGQLFRLDPATGKVRGSCKLAFTTQDLASDGKRLWAVTTRWPGKEGLMQLDPRTGEVLRTLEQQAPKVEKGKRPTRHAARGVTWHDGHLYVLEIYGQLHEIAPESGKTLRTVATGRRWVFSLADDGKDFFAATREGLDFFDKNTLKFERSIAIPRRLRSAGWGDDAWLLMEQPIFGFGKKHEKIQVFPRPGKTLIHRLRRGVREQERPDKTDGPKRRAGHG